MNVREMVRRADERRREEAAARLSQPAPPRPETAREPLAASQHILHLLLTVLTGGLWAPVWLVRAWRGNPGPERDG
jgi:hypothetical protein